MGRTFRLIFMCIIIVFAQYSIRGKNLIGSKNMCDCMAVIEYLFYCHSQLITNFHVSCAWAFVYMCVCVCVGSFSFSFPSFLLRLLDHSLSLSQFTHSVCVYVYVFVDNLLKGQYQFCGPYSSVWIDEIDKMRKIMLFVAFLFIWYVVVGILSEAYIVFDIFWFNRIYYAKSCWLLLCG